MTYQQTTAEQKRAQLATIPAPDREEIVTQVQEYMAAAHLQPSQMAAFIGYSVNTLHRLLSGSYHQISGNDRSIRKALIEFMTANPIGVIESVGGTFYETENTAVLREQFRYCLALDKKRGRTGCVYGAPGEQKTHTIEYLVAELNREYLHVEDRPRAFYIYCSQDERPLSLTNKMLRAAGVPRAGRIENNFANLRFLLRRHRCLFVFDEAQHLSLSCLEIIRELHDLKPHFGVLLAGSHRLRQLFNRHAAEMEQWHSRISAAVELPGISRATLERIVRAELGGGMQLNTPEAQEAIDELLNSANVSDTFSGKKGKRYYNVRTVFNSIERLKDAIAEQEGAMQ